MSYLKAAFLIFCIHIAFASAGWLIAEQMGAIVATLIALVFHLIVLWRADTIVLQLHGAREVTLEDPSPILRAYAADTQALAQKAGLAPPRIFVVEAHQPNAFVAGRDALHASVAVTTGLLKTVTREEARAVIAHELAHVKRGDALAMGVSASLAALVTRFVWLLTAPFGASRAATRATARIIARLSASRSREYAADREAGLICGDPLNLARALDKIERNASSLLNPLAEKNPATAHMYVVDPLHGPTRTKGSTHPPTENRIARLHRQAMEAETSDET
ncbi:MAG: M48 family metalloprotease [Pseudomonadota bacterium]